MTLLLEYLNMQGAKLSGLYYSLHRPGEHCFVAAKLIECQLKTITACS